MDNRNCLHYLFIDVRHRYITEIRIMLGEIVTIEVAISAAT
jgi:hypothetical protein